MPELPEVETTRRGIEPELSGRTVERLVLRESRLRWPVDATLGARLAGQALERVERRAKYLLLRFSTGTLLVHFGMSGSLSLTRPPVPAPRPHDHFDLVFRGGSVLRYHDPRRFGCAVWVEGEVSAHPLLSELGPEPLGDGFNGSYLYGHSRGRRVAVKSFLMDGRVVVGVGNIYANEALHRAGIAPQRAAGRISATRYDGLADAVRGVLGEAIERGGTTLRDYRNGAGEQGWFGLNLRVYGRNGQPCPACGDPIRQFGIGGRSTYQCPGCQR